MLLRNIITGGLMIALTTLSAGAAKKATARHHRPQSISRQYANAVKPQEQIQKFRVFTEEDIHPADALYSSVWSNTHLNPYKLSLPDSFKICVSDFQAPIVSRVTSEYGPRWGRFHAGIDIALKQGDSVRVAFDGEVRIAHKFNKGGYGWYVVVRHDNGLETLYGHLKKPLVKDNQHVKAGDVIGLGGNTGRSTGPHLHFETRFLGMPMNPRNIIDFDENVILSDTYTIDKEDSFDEWNSFHNPRHRYAKGRKGKHGKMSFMKDYAKAGSNNIYKVRNGDNLYTIARANKTTVKELCRLNGLDEKAILKLGKKLKVR